VDEGIGAVVVRPAGRALPGVDVPRAAEPVLWALVDSVAGQLGQRTPDGLRVVLDGRAAALERRDRRGRRRRRILSLPLAHVVGLSCAELRIVIAGELGSLATPGARSSRWVSAAAGRFGRTMVGLEHRRSPLCHPLRPYARALFGASSRLERRRELAGSGLAAGLYGAEAVARTASHADSLAVAFDWFWSIEVRPFLDRGWRPPIAEGFRSFLDAPLVRERTSGIAPDGSTGDLLASVDAVEAGLLAEPSLVWVGWQEGAAGVVLSVWDGHVRRAQVSGGGLRVWEVGHQVEASIEAYGSDQAGLQAALAGLGSGLALALAGDGWRICKLPGRAAILSKGGVELRPDLEITRLRSSRTTPAIWAERCERLGIGELRLGGLAPDAGRAAANQVTAGSSAVS